MMTINTATTTSSKSSLQSSPSIPTLPKHRNNVNSNKIEKECSNMESKSSSTTTTAKKTSKTMPKRIVDGNNGYPITVMQNECTAIKKGLLWELQQSKIFLFNRWKERYFILTQDYLTCFKKGSKRVGMSEMGNFVYKINLNEIQNINWVDKKKNGVIGIQFENSSILLWNGIDIILDEWMSVLQESIMKRLKERRVAEQQSAALMRKSSTLLPKVILNLSNQNNKINNNDNDNGHDSPIINRLKLSNEINGIVSTPTPPPPPPPPPRRYLRCLSTDLGTSTASTTIDSKQRIMTPSLSRNSMVNNLIHNSPLMVGANDNYKGIMAARKPSDASSTATATTTSSLISQSLRCKSSYALQCSPLLSNNNNNNIIMNNSPLPLTNNQMSKRIITKQRISTFNPQQKQFNIERNFNNKTIQNVMLHTKRFPNQSIPLTTTESSSETTTATYASSFFQSADSEFLFVNSKATTFRPESMIVARTPNNHGSPIIKNNNNSPRYSYNGYRQSRISSSASLMLNSRHNGGKDYRYLLDSSSSTPPPPPPPPPIPPHRTHLHNF